MLPPNHTLLPQFTLRVLLVGAVIAVLLILASLQKIGSYLGLTTLGVIVIASSRLLERNR